MERGEDGRRPRATSSSPSPEPAGTSGRGHLPRLSASPSPQQRLPGQAGQPGSWWSARAPSTHELSQRSRRGRIADLSSSGAGSPPRQVPTGQRRPSEREGHNQTLREEPVREAAHNNQPFLGERFIPNRRTRAGRAWNQGNLANQQFTIYQNAQEFDPSLARRAVPRANFDDERENRYGPEYEVEEEPVPPRRNVDWSILQTAPRDAYGLPHNFIELAQRAGVSVNLADDAPAGPRVNQTPAQPAAEAERGDEDEWEED